jgi:hypothetical protein
MYFEDENIMKIRIEKNSCDSSSSAGFFHKSSDDSHSNNILSDTSGSELTEELVKVAPHRPVKIDCWRENICSDLAAFGREKIQRSANHAPHPSPKKKFYNPALSETDNTALIKTKLNNALFFYTPQGKEHYKQNQLIFSIDEQAGRSYQSLMFTARAFMEILELKGTGNCENLLRKYGVQNAVELANNIHTITPVRLLMFLFIIDKYPTAPQDAISKYFEKCKNEVNDDCYAAFKHLDNYCYENFPTKNTVNDYIEEDDFTASIFFPK